jgi:hypothetical protein
VITRNGLIGLIVLLAGLTTGYFASIEVNSFHDRVLSELPDSLPDDAMAEASFTLLGTLYDHSKLHFRSVVNQGSEALREAALRRHLMEQEHDSVMEDSEIYDSLSLLSDREVDLLRLEDYYRQFFMHYYRWLDMGDEQSLVSYKLALGQFSTTLDYLIEKYREDPCFTHQELDAFQTVIRITKQTGLTVRLARVAIVVLIFILMMGIPRFIRDSGYKKFAASLFFDALFRPHRVSDINRWHSKQRMGSLLGVVYLLGLFIFSSFSSWKLPLILGGLGLVPVLLLAGLSGNYRKWPEMIVSFMAPKMPVISIILVIAAVRGSVFFFYRFWSAEPFRLLIILFFSMLVFRRFHTNMILVHQWSHRNRTGSAAMVFMALGSQLLLSGILIYRFGFAESMALLNRELALLPGDFFTSLPEQLPWLMMVGGLLTIGSFMLFIFNRKKETRPLRSS